MITTYYKNLLANALFAGKTSDQICTYYIGLSTTEPNQDGTGINEPMLSSGYARIKCYPTTDADNGTVTNSSTLSWGEVTSDWDTVTHWVAFDSANGGNLLLYDALFEPRTIVAGSTIGIKKGELNFSIGDVVDGVDTSDATATSEDILYGKSAYVNGEKIFGTMAICDTMDLDIDLGNMTKERYFSEEDNAFIQRSSYVVGGAGGIFTKRYGAVIDASMLDATDSDIRKGKKAFTSEGAIVGTYEGDSSGSQGVDTSDATATSSHILSGKTAYVSTGKVTGTIPSVGSTTITPGTSNKVAVSSGKYTTENIYVAGDSNLIASNIKSGISIFGVTGTFNGTKNYFQGAGFDASAKTFSIPGEYTYIAFHYVRITSDGYSVTGNGAFNSYMDQEFDAGHTEPFSVSNSDGGTIIYFPNPPSNFFSGKTSMYIWAA